MSEYTREERLRAIASALIDEFFPSAPATVLDVGCGAGRTTIGLAKRGFRPVGTDLSKTLLVRARQRYGGVDFQLMDATRPGFCDGSVDAALFSYNGIDGICLLAARVRCLAEVFRILKSGGPFLLSSHSLIGTIFSGGYHYLHGYWRAARMLAMQCTNPVVRDWHFRYSDGGGFQHLYSAPAGHTVRNLERVGFRVQGVRGEAGEHRPRVIAMRHQHAHFAARKPT